MQFLHDRKRAGVIAVATGLLGAAALFFGMGAANAAYPCNDDSAPQDTTVNVNNQTFVGVDTNLTTGSPTTPWVWACAAATGGEGNQRFVVVTANPSSPTTGYTVQAGGCTGVVGGDPYGPGCTYLLKSTGADVGNPATSLTTSGSRPNASAGLGSGTCTYANGTPTCPVGGFTIAGVTVNEADLIPTVTPYTPTPPCTGINNTCIPVGATVEVGQDTSNPAIRVATLAATPTDVDTGPQCVQVNATC